MPVPTVMYTRLSSPTPAPQRCSPSAGVHVGVERDGQVEGLLNRTKQIGVRPARLRGIQHVPVGRGFGMQIERTERTDTNGRERSLPVMPEKKVIDFCQRFGRSGRRDAYSVPNVMWPRADRADDLAAARLYCAKEHVGEYWGGCLISQSKPLSGQPVFVGAGFKPALQHQRHHHRHSCEGRNPSSVLCYQPSDGREAIIFFMFRGVGDSRHEGFL